MKKCILCENSLDLILDFGEQSLANGLLDQIEQPSPRFPLSLSRCSSCGHIQLRERIPPERLFSHYLWVTGTSKGAVDFSCELCRIILNYQSNVRSVLEIASNDGTFLRPFSQANIDVLGIDPAENIAKLANDNGIKTICEFFSYKSAEKLKNNLKKEYDVILARNVIAHTPDPIDLLKGVQTLLSPTGHAYIEFHDAFNILKSNQYDSIYHEHYSYFYLKSFTFAAKKAGLRVIDIIKSPISGGALIVVLSKDLNSNINEKCDLKLKEDNKLRISKLDAWLEFAGISINHSKKLSELIKNAASKGPVYGYGSSARSNTMLSFCGVDSKSIKFIVDKSPLKHGKFTPGTRIPIKDIKYLPKEKSTLILLAWNFKNEIIDDLKAMGYHDLFFIQPLPDDPVIYSIN